MGRPERRRDRPGLRRRASVLRRHRRGRRARAPRSASPRGSAASSRIPSPLKRLTINLGLRADHHEGLEPGPLQGRGDRIPVALAIGETYFEPTYGLNPYGEVAYDTWDNAFPYGMFFSPRLGLTYDLFGNGKTALKASFTRQQESFPTGLVLGHVSPDVAQASPGTGGTTTRTASRTCPGVDKYEEAYGDTPLAMVSTAYLDSIDPDVKVPYVDEITLGIEHELVKDLRVSARYINKVRKRIMASVLWDKDSDRYWYTQDLAPEWWVPFTTTVPETGSYPAQEVTMYFLSNDAPEQFRRLTNVPEAQSEIQLPRDRLRQAAGQGLAARRLRQLHEAQGQLLPGLCVVGLGVQYLDPELVRQRLWRAGVQPAHRHQALRHVQTCPMISCSLSTTRTMTARRGDGRSRSSRRRPGRRPITPRRTSYTDQSQTARAPSGTRRPTISI
ncbi:MAG: hypothetical protein MZV63_58970 [Marinilabiliales bacterium]|nr:hypothetical protein [Marinilabiliales bacterium]